MHIQFGAHVQVNITLLVSNFTGSHTLRTLDVCWCTIFTLIFVLYCVFGVCVYVCMHELVYDCLCMSNGSNNICFV